MLKQTIFKTIALGAVLVMALPSCNTEENHRGLEYMPDMYRGPALQAYEPYARYSDSTSSRLPVAGTIPRGFESYQAFSPDQTGYDSSKVMATIPEAYTNELALAEGKELYAIFCGQCHGDKGDGQGILVKNEKFLGVPSYADRDINYGTIFHVVTYGKGVMGSHASQVTPQERWKIARYVMQLKKDLAPDDEDSDESEENDS